MSLQHITQFAIQLSRTRGEGENVLSEDGRLLLFKANTPSPLNATLYEPALCLILQGSKEVMLRRSEIRVAAGQALIVSHALPVAARITTASKVNPYIALVLKTAPGLFRELSAPVGESFQTGGTSQSLEVGTAGEQLTDALLRLVQSTQDQTDAQVLYPQILREVHFRLLQAPFAGMLRILSRLDSHAGHVSRAIAAIRTKFSEPLSINELAQRVGMSRSSFHHHFKTITGSTPLQYQKDLRLLEARKLITREGETVTLAAFRVGYESPNQFSREYARKFGVTPSADGRGIS